MNNLGRADDGMDGPALPVLPSYRRKRLYTEGPTRISVSYEDCRCVMPPPSIPWPCSSAAPIRPNWQRPFNFVEFSRRDVVPTSLENSFLERIPQKLTDFCDKNSLQLLNLARFLIAQTIPFERKAR